MPRLASMPVLLAALGALAACATPPAGPRLLSTDEIAQAAQGAQTPPDTAPLQARAARLSARAAALRRAGADDEERRRMQQRAGQIASR